MNRNKLKVYAPKARRDFIKAVTDRAAFYGLTKKKIEPVAMQGDVTIIGGKPFPRDVGEKRRRLEERIEREGFEQVMEAMAYTWFNRFVAIRFMEVHGYLDHGYRVLSTSNNANDTNKVWTVSGVPEILASAEHVDLPGLDREKVVELKLVGNRDEELYRMLLIAQCNALHKAMPFLFEWIGDATELLLPENLLHSDSLIRNLVNEIPEEDWQEIEVIGWLYQFYISEKKDQVIGKVVKSEDIPAATQLFTPNWIVKYMVQNSLGAQWLATYPHSPLKGQMEFYIEPAAQTEEVQAQLAAITPSQLNPQELTLIDPASGSGHILVEAYELFKAIYLERGYRQADVALLILEKNLFGLDIDERAAQLTGFALMMKGRTDDRRLFERGVKLNVMALVDSAGFDAEGLAQGVKLADYGLKPRDLTELKRLFEYATTFGSLIQVPEGLAEQLPALKELTEGTSGDLFVSNALKRLGPLVRQAKLLAAQYDAVVMNPPYMGSGGMNAPVKKFAKDHFPDVKSDLFACFIERGCALAKDDGHNAMVTMQSWMFLAAFEKMRERILGEKTIKVMAHLGPRAFGSISGEVVQTTTFVLGNRPLLGFKPVFLRLLDGGEEEKRAALVNGENRFDTTAQDEFRKIPGSPVAYWVSERIRGTFSGPKVSDFGKTRVGCQTSDNNRFLRLWHEVSEGKTCLSASTRDEAAASNRKWFPYNKGGSYRKWSGNLEFVLNWEDDGREIFRYARDLYGSPTRTVKNGGYYFRPSVTWSKISSGIPSFRYQPAGAVFDVAGASVFFESIPIRDLLLSQLNSVLCVQQLAAISPTLNFETSHIAALPVAEKGSIPGGKISAICETAIAKTAEDWNVYERSWDFQSLPILTASSEPAPTLESSYTAWITQNRDTITEIKRLEEENNRLFIDAYGLADELTPDVPIEQITLTVNPAYRYGGKLTEEEQWTRFRQDTMAELVSYAIGCMMGRYSLDAPGLIYAHSGNDGFDPSRYTTFPADADGIVPLTEIEWFDDDAAHRLIEFISVVWDADHLEDNLTFLADNLAPKKNESSREMLRRYLCDSFFKDHLQTYKKRPIYWLFSSGKQKAFQCLVYLHRYNEGTLSRMRTEYVIPLQGKISARIEQLAGDISAASSTAHSKKLLRERDTLIKQQAELQTFDEKLRHYADQRISLDLDDGVKVNYGKFGDLLAEVNAVTGRK